MQNSSSRVVSVLREAGFTVSQSCCSRPSCFDFAARRENTLAFVKVQPDADCYSSTDSMEMVNIGSCVSAACLLVSEKTRGKPLEHDTIYSRHGVPFVTLDTLEGITSRSFHPLVQAGPGGYYVQIDGTVLRRKRQELGLSIGDLAKIIGVSRRTVYGYEMGLAKASVAAAYNLIAALGMPVARPVNVFEAQKSRQKCFLVNARMAFARSKLLQRIFRKFSRYGKYNIAAVKRAPFDFLIALPDGKMRIMGAIAQDEIVKSQLDKRVDEVLSVSKIVQAQPVFVTESSSVPIDGIPCVSSEDLARMDRAEDLVSRFT